MAKMTKSNDWQTSSKRPIGNPIGRSNMQLYTTPNGLEIWFKNCSLKESVVGWYSKTTTYDVSHMQLYWYVVLSRGITVVLQDSKQNTLYLKC